MGALLPEDTRVVPAAFFGGTHPLTLLPSLRSLSLCAHLLILHRHTDTHTHKQTRAPACTFQHPSSSFSYIYHCVCVLLPRVQAGSSFS